MPVCLKSFYLSSVGLIKVSMKRVAPHIKLFFYKSLRLRNKKRRYNFFHTNFNSYVCFPCLFFTSLCFSDILPSSSNSSTTKPKRKESGIKLFPSSGELNSLLIFILALFFTSCSAGGSNSSLIFNKANLKIGNKTLNVEIADTPEKKTPRPYAQDKIKGRLWNAFYF